MTINDSIDLVVCQRDQQFDSTELTNRIFIYKLFPGRDCHFQVVAPTMADSPPVEIFNISPRVRLTIIILFSCQYFTTACAYAVIAPFFPIVVSSVHLQSFF